MELCVVLTRAHVRPSFPDSRQAGSPFQILVVALALSPCLPFGAFQRRAAYLEKTQVLTTRAF